MRGDGRPPPGSGARSGAVRRWAAAAVVAVAGGAAAGHTASPEPAGAVPAAARLAAGVELPADAARAPLLAAPGDAPAAAPAALAAALGPSLADERLGGRVLGAVRDARTGQVLLDRGGGQAALPASTTKILTAVAALAALDPGARLTTRVRAGRARDEVVLVGGGDTTLAGRSAPAGYPRRARLAELADATRGALRGRRVTRVLVDDALYPGPRTARGWRPTYVTGGNAMPVTALAVDAGRTAPGRGPGRTAPREADPALAAGRAFAAALGARRADVRRGTAGSGTRELAAVASPPVPVLVEQMLTRSDNDLAESLARQVALARGRPATFAGAAQAVTEVLGEVVPGLPPGSVRLADASGLSRDDRIAPDALARVLVAVVRAAEAAPAGTGSRGARLAPVLSGLPVAGFDGTLSLRFRSGRAAAAAGRVRGKTGTLDGVSALAGLVRTADGRLLAFDLVADQARLGEPRRAESGLDRVVSTLAGCGCR